MVKLQSPQLGWCCCAHHWLQRCESVALIMHRAPAECSECVAPLARQRADSACRWCQRLAGLDLLQQEACTGPEAIDLQQYRQEQRALSFVRLLRLRCSHLDALQCAAFAVEQQLVACRTTRMPDMQAK